MKAHRLLLTADTRGNQQVLYKEFIGHKALIKKAKTYNKESKTPATVFIKRVRLYDSTTNTYIKQTVFLRVIGITKQFLQVEVI